MSVPLPGWFAADAGAPDRRPARGRHPRPAARHPLRRPAAQRPHRARTSASPRTCGARSSRTASATPASRPRCGCASASASAARASAACTSATRSASSARRRWTTCSTTSTTFLVTHPGEVLVMINQDYVTPAGLRRRVDDAGPRPPTRSRRPAAVAWPTLREMIDADRRLVVLAENRGRRGALVPARLRAADPGDAVRRSRAPAQLTDAGERWRRAAAPTAGRRARRCSSSTTGSTPTRCRARATPRWSTPTTPLLRRARDVRAHPRPRRTCSRSTSTSAATSSGSSTRSTRWGLGAGVALGCASPALGGLDLAVLRRRVRGQAVEQLGGRGGDPRRRA